jgi:hypothetical protein
MNVDGLMLPHDIRTNVAVSVMIVDNRQTALHRQRRA